jgi:hypothetical protein
MSPAEAAPARRRAVVVPPVPGLLSEHASLTDPFSALRSACREAVEILVSGAPDRVALLADPDDPWAGRVADTLLAEAGHRGGLTAGPGGGTDAVLVMANGTARRGERSPGGADGRAPEFDERVEKALIGCDSVGLQSLDAELGGALLASGTRTLQDLGSLLEQGSWSARLLYSGDPFGVQYWVAAFADG